MRHLDKKEAKRILQASRLGILGLSDAGRSYAVPLFFAYDGQRVFFHCHPGMKDEYIEATEEACLTVVHMNTENVWESVQVFGKLSKLSVSDDIEAAKNALYKIPFPPMEGEYPSGKPIRSDQHVYYMSLEPGRIEGMGSTYQEAQHA